jgi:ring-1,2-phenylacetyl-CoA epoxidase subunit PaaE
LNIKPLIKLHLVYGNKNFETTLFSSLIDDLGYKHPNTFSFTHFHSQAEMNGDTILVKEGRIHQSFILDLVKDSDVSKTMHYICGPADLKETIKNTLAILKYPNSNIFSEDFELVIDPKDFEDIITQNVTISFLGVENQIEVLKGKSILDVALDSGIEVPYSCQTGICNTCKGLLKKGGMKMIGLTNERTDLQKEEYLLCCSYPLTDNVYIEIEQL